MSTKMRNPTKCLILLAVTLSISVGNGITTGGKNSIGFTPLTSEYQLINLLQRDDSIVTERSKRVALTGEPKLKRPEISEELIDNYNRNAGVTPKPCLFDTKVVDLILRNNFANATKLNRLSVIKSMCILPKIVTSTKDRHKLWEIIKDGKDTATLTINDLQLGLCLLPSIPESELLNLNVQDWDIIGFLGKVEGFKRRHMGILAYALMKTWGVNILTPEYINKMYGILCGFSPERLNKISSTNYALISSDVFMYIGACTSRQLAVLYTINMNPKVHGQIQSWTSNDIKEMGLVLKGIQRQDFAAINPRAMKGVSYRTIKALAPELLMKFSREQVKNLQAKSMEEFYKRVPVFSTTNTINVTSSLLIILLTIIFI